MTTENSTVSYVYDSLTNGGGKTITYSYDHNGIRTSKTVNGVVHTYHYASGKLLRETYGNNTLDFFYDASGMPFAVSHNGTVYYYITNLQGDVMQLVDANGTKVAEYEYDPYGTVISATGTMAEINPLRYRGYYYDTETELYYLQSRYYDPEIGRFINADSYTSTGQGILGCNMFAYCNNNPIIYSDEEGTSLTLAAAIGGATAGALISLTSYLVGCGIGGTEISIDGITQALIAGMISGVFGAAAGSVMEATLKALYSGFAAFAAAIYAQTNGGNWMIAFGATFLGAFVGSWIDTSALDELAEGFANYAVALFTGAPAEILSSGTQNLYNGTPISNSTPTSTTMPSITSTSSNQGGISGGGGRYITRHRIT